MITTIIDIIHYGITIFVILGGIITSDTRILIYHLFASTSVLFHWLINNHKCMISELCGHSDNDFTMSMVKVLNLGIENISNDVMTVGIYILLIILITITYLKLMAQYNTLNNISVIH